MDWNLTEHARTVMKERGIEPAWVELVLEGPAVLSRDPRDPALLHAIGPVTEREGRMLRVVHDRSAIPIRVITVFFDRRLRG